MVALSSLNDIIHNQLPKYQPIIIEVYQSKEFTLKSYGCCLTNSGDKYNGVPTLVPCKEAALDTIVETPRSPS